MAFTTTPATTSTMFDPATLLKMSAQMFAAPNFQQGLGGSLDALSTSMTEAKTKREAETLRNQTADMLEKSAPEIAAQVRSGALSNTDGLRLYYQQKKDAAEASRPDYQVMDVNGKIVRVDKRDGSFDQLADYSQPKVSAEYQDFQDQQRDPAYRAAKEEERRLKDAPTSSDRLKTELDVRKTYRAEPSVKDYQTVKTAYQKGRQAAQMDSAAGDMSLVYSFMKMQDPDSVVREGEYATAEKAGSAQDWVVNIYNRIRTGQRLTPQQKADFVKAMDEQYQIATSSLSDTNSQYEPFMDENQLPKDRLLVQPEKFEPLKLGGPPAEVTLPDGTQGTIRRTK